MTDTLALARARTLALALDLARTLALDLDRARTLALALDLDRALALDLARALDALIVKADMLGASVIGDYVQCARNHLDELIKLAEA